MKAFYSPRCRFITLNSRDDAPPPIALPSQGQIQTMSRAARCLEAWHPPVSLDLFSIAPALHLLLSTPVPNSSVFPKCPCALKFLSLCKNCYLHLENPSPSFFFLFPQLVPTQPGQSHFLHEAFLDLSVGRTSVSIAPGTPVHRSYHIVLQVGLSVSFLSDLA